MKLSDYVRKFDNIEKSLQAKQINTLTKDQSDIFRDIFATYNQSGVRYAVLDAPSGTGKTTLIRAMQKYAKTNSIRIDVTATTGKASSALNGQTIHSYMDMKMIANEVAENKDEAIKLSVNAEFTPDPELDILVIDEASMLGQKLFSTIDRANFRYVLFVLDSSQLPPVKEKRVEWDKIADRQYRLTKTLRAKNPQMLKLFDDFKKYRDGKVDNLNLMDYIDNESIVSIDFEDVDKLPTNTESCIVAYRNKLVEYFVDKTTDKNHNMYNLNRGVVVTRMVAVDDTPNDRGFFDREFVNTQCYYNGEDVQIIKLNSITQALTKNKWAVYKNYKLVINKKMTGITISNINAKVPYNAKESSEDKYFLKFPNNDILECCTLAVINDKYFVLLWDDSEEEFEYMLEYYFSKLAPYLKTMRAIQAYRKKPCMENLEKLPVYIRPKIRDLSKQAFNEWFDNQQESLERRKAWGEFLTASTVVSARPTTSRTIYKAQGISVPCIAISDQSFYGASLSAQYVAITRGKHGLILIKNTPEEWKGIK